MSAEWYIRKEGSQHGPYTREQFCAFAREERVQAGDNVWKSGMAAWTPAWEVAGPMPQQPGGDRGEDEAPPPMPGGSGEEFLGVVPHLGKKVGLMKSKTFTIVVTDRRLLFAELTQEIVSEAVQEAVTDSSI